EPINTFHGIQHNEDEPIRVSYHRNIHYNSVVNPNKATIGVGLGLPSFKPGLAEQSLMKSAIKTSEESWIEQQMLEDKKRATDWEATNEAIEEQVARESYLQWLRDQEKQARQVGPQKRPPPSCDRDPCDRVLVSLSPPTPGVPVPVFPSLSPSISGVPIPLATNFCPKPPFLPPTQGPAASWGRGGAGPPPLWCPCTPPWSAGPSCSKCPPQPSVSRGGWGGGIWG
ncbi:OTUD5 protein, partial [Neopipo cinnamomea]|nr:OTUD5 protein [Neopipo cinnamomea]